MAELSRQSGVSEKSLASILAQQNSMLCRTWAMITSISVAQEILENEKPTATPTPPPGLYIGPIPDSLMPKLFLECLRQRKAPQDLVIGILESALS
jgi:hypothetical protein